MSTPQEIAQLLICSWTLADPMQRRIPVNNGVLDKAIKSAVGDKLFPDWAEGSLHFADTRVGLRCIELPDILEWAQLAELTSSPNPSYRYAEVQVDERTARRIISWLGFDETAAQSLGKRIQREIGREMALGAPEPVSATA